MPLRDASLKVRSDTPAAFDSSNAEAKTNVLELEGTPLHGLAMKVTISTFTTGATDPTVNVYIHGSTTTTAATTASKIIGQKTGMAGATSDQYISYIIPFVDPEVRSIMAEITTTVTTGTGAWSIASVQLYVVNNVGRDWNREVAFH